MLHNVLIRMRYMKICLQVLQLALPLNSKSAQVYILERLQACRLLTTIGSRKPATLWIIKFPQLMFFPGDTPVAITQNVA